MDFECVVNNPNFKMLGYITAVANLSDKHDRSAPSDYHWKILKCRYVQQDLTSVRATITSRNTIINLHKSLVN